MTNKDKFTVEHMEKALREAKGFVTIAAKRAGCAYNTLMRYINKSSKLQKVLEEINEEMVDFSESKLMSQINEGNTTAIIFHLKCKGKKRGYIERIEQEHSGPGGGPVIIEQKYSNWTDEELEKYAKTGIRPDRFNR